MAPLEQIIQRLVESGVQADIAAQLQQMDYWSRVLEGDKGTWAEGLAGADLLYMENLTLECFLKEVPISLWQRIWIWICLLFGKKKLPFGQVKLYTFTNKSDAEQCLGIVVTLRRTAQGNNTADYIIKMKETSPLLKNTYVT
jgi:hypothetical protein